MQQSSAYPPQARHSYPYHSSVAPQSTPVIPTGAGSAYVYAVQPPPRRRSQSLSSASQSHNDYTSYTQHHPRDNTRSHSTARPHSYIHDDRSPRRSATLPAAHAYRDIQSHTHHRDGASHYLSTAHEHHSSSRRGATLPAYAITPQESQSQSQSQSHTSHRTHSTHRHSHRSHHHHDHSRSHSTPRSSDTGPGALATYAIVDNRMYAPAPGGYLIIPPKGSRVKNIIVSLRFLVSIQTTLILIF